MKKKQKRLKKILKELRLYLIFLAALVVLGTVAFVLLRGQLLKNMQDVGTAVARSYASEEQNNLTVYETIMNFGTQTVENWKERGWTRQEIETWLEIYFERFQKVAGENVVDPYAVVDGEIIAANPWEGDSSYDVTATEWYQKARAAEGAVIFTGAYSDAVSGKQVITIAQKCEASDVILAFDVFPENFQLQDDSLTMMKGASYFLCDESGNVIYMQTDLSGSREVIEDYVRELLDEVRAGEMDEYDAAVRDVDGQKRNVYYAQMSNGWYSIVTIPYAEILGNLYHLFFLFVGIFVIVIAAFAFIFWRDYRISARMGYINETVQILGNIYYALYRIDYEEKTYTMIKGSSYVRERLPEKGDYEALLKVAGEVIEEKAYQEFVESFSAESIRRLVARQAGGFGGDFQRLFDGEYRWVNVSLLFDEALKSGEALLCFREVQQEKQVQLQERSLLETALENSRRSEKTKHAFFNNMSHDMRTPLNAIEGLTGLALEHIDDKERVEDYLHKISRSSRQLLELVNDILEMSRMEQGKVILNSEQFDLKASIEECAEPFRLQAEKDGKSFLEEYSLQDPVVLGDPFRMTQIMNNLLSNALKFTNRGDTISVRVTQLKENEHAQYQITVKDTGIGMSEEFLSKLFEPYARETRFSTRQITGTGLGMPIVKNLVTQMSGQIHVESTLGEGTSFVITVPLMPVEETGQKQRDEAETSADGFSLEGKHILLVEDNVINMEIAQEILSENGLLIDEAWNGEEAVEKFAESKPYEYDAILMDMKMPKMDGCEAARQIRAMTRPDAKRVPIIAVTANAFTEDIAESTAAGMDAHISKPIDFKLLCRTLEELTEGTDRE